MTGGAKGIGAAIVRLLAGEGAVPVIVDRDAEAGAQLQNEVRSQGAACGLVTVELANPEDCSRAVEQAVKAFGRLDALVNNAGRNDKSRPGAGKSARICGLAQNATWCITTAWRITPCRI